MISRAHHTAWPRPSGACWRVKLVWPAAGSASAKNIKCFLLVALAQGLFKFNLQIKMILDHTLVAAGDKNKMLDPGRAGLIDHILNDRFVDDCQHFLGHGLGGRQEPCSKAGDRENGLANRLVGVDVGYECLLSVSDF